MALRGAAASRYAQAVFDIAKESGKLEQWRADLKTLTGLFGDERTVAALEDPRRTQQTRRQIAEALLAKQSVQPLAINFLMLLIQRNRLALLPRIVESFGEMYNKEKGIVIAEVTTAVPLDEARQKQVAARISDMTGGKTVDLRVKTDPRILGGIVTRIGDELIDASIATRLADLAERLS